MQVHALHKYSSKGSWFAAPKISTCKHAADLVLGINCILARVPVWGEAIAARKPVKPAQLRTQKHHKILQHTSGRTTMPETLVRGANDHLGFR